MTVPTFTENLAAVNNYTAAVDCPIFAPGDEVYRLASYTPTPTAWPPVSPVVNIATGSKVPSESDAVCIVLDGPFDIILEDAGAGKITDQRHLATSPADGTSATGVTGFLHTASPEATLGSSISNKFWYRVQDALNNIIIVHQSQMTNKTSINTYIAATHEYT
jgi:hypothetical protein